jgi:hypothetical protein
MFVLVCDDRLAELLKGGGSDESEDDFWGEGGAGAELFGDDPGDGASNLFGPRWL